MKMKHRSQHITRANEEIVIELLNLLNTTLKDFAFGINREDLESGEAFIQTSYFPLLDDDDDCVHWFITQFDRMMIMVGILQETRMFDRIMIEDPSLFRQNTLLKIQRALRSYENRTEVE